MVKRILIFINCVALGIAFFWGYTKKFEPEQLVTILGLIATLVALFFDKLKSSFTSQTLKVKGDRNFTEQHASASRDEQINQELDVEKNDNKNTQNS